MLHCTVVWINPPASLVKSKKHPDLAAFGKGLKSFFFFISISFTRLHNGIKTFYIITARLKVFFVHL